MDSQFWKKEPTKKSRVTQRRILDIEDFDNYDHWTRDCRVRAEAWFVIESWAREHGFHMVAYKSKKRLYQKGMAPDSFITFLEVRHEEGRVVLKSWIEVSSRMRWLTLFQIPKELKIDPVGFLAIRVRRKTCHEINDLLIRLKQPELADLAGFHWADLNLTTLFLLGSLPLPIILFVAGLLGKIEIAAGLSNNLLSLMGEKLVWIFGVGISSILIHHFLIVKQLKKEWANWASFSFAFTLFLVLNIFLLTRTTTEMMDQKLVHYCVSHFTESKCKSYLDRLSPNDRQVLVKRMEVLQKHLAIKKE